MASPYAPARVHPTMGGRPHTGVDLKATLGTQIVAAGAGIAESSFNHPSYGETVIVRHTNGAATLYAHLNTRSVTVGNSIVLGDQIGTAGRTGRASGVHLHFEYITEGSVMGSNHRIDPLPCLKNKDAYFEFMDVWKYLDPDDDDIFRISVVDEQTARISYYSGQTAPGEVFTADLSHLSPGKYYFCYEAIVAPDNQATVEFRPFGAAYWNSTKNQQLTWHSYVTTYSGRRCTGFEIIH